MNNNQNHTVTGTRKDVVSIEERALIAYHADCIDGFTAAWVTAKAMEDRGMLYELLPMHYTLAGDQLLLKQLNIKFDYLYVVDFSLSIEMLEEIGNIYPGLKTAVIDHHKTAFERYAPQISPIEIDSTFSDMVAGALIVLDNDQSGASLCFKYFNPSIRDLPWLVWYVRDYDLWRFKFGDETKWVNKYLSHRQFSITAWDRIAAELSDTEGKKAILQEGKRLQASHDFKVDTVAKGAVQVRIEGQIGLGVQCPLDFINDVGAILATKSGTFGAMYQINIEKEEIKWSLRSNKGFDVSAIAKKHGGGGHETSAGFYKELF